MKLGKLQLGGHSRSTHTKACPVADLEPCHFSSSCNLAYLIGFFPTYLPFFAATSSRNADIHNRQQAKACPLQVYLAYVPKVAAGDEKLQAARRRAGLDIGSEQVSTKLHFMAA